MSQRAGNAHGKGAHRTRASGKQDSPIQAIAAGSQHGQDTDEAHQNSGPMPPADLFWQHQGCQGGDKNQPYKCDGDILGQRIRRRPETTK